MPLTQRELLRAIPSCLFCKEIFQPGLILTFEKEADLSIFLFLSSITNQPKAISFCLAPSFLCINFDSIGEAVA